MLLGDNYDMQMTMFQPVGGMGMVGQAFARELGPLIRYNAKVIDIAQDERGVSVTFEDTSQSMSRQTAHADWCVCTIPLSILGQIPMKVGTPMADAIAAVPYAASVKVGLQFKRRFWEEDEQIYGGITYTDLPISNISYPNYGFFSSGKGVLLGGYLFGVDAAEFTAMSPQERVAKAVEYGSRIHPQYPAGVRQRHRGRLAPLALHAGLFRHVDRGGARQALRQSVRHRRAHRPRRRARLVHARLAGGCAHLVGRCHRSIASARVAQERPRERRRTLR